MSSQSVLMPPVTCVPHSIRWPATVAPAKSIEIILVPAKVMDAGATTSDGSATRPGNHDVGPVGKSFDDRRCAEIGVRRHQSIANAG